MKPETVDLRPLKRWLQKGEIFEICKEVGISTGQASNIISGRSPNWMFVENFLRRVEYHKSLKERIELLYAEQEKIRKELGPEKPKVKRIFKVLDVDPKLTGVDIIEHLKTPQLLPNDILESEVRQVFAPDHLKYAWGKLAELGFWPKVSAEEIGFQLQHRSSRKSNTKYIFDIGERVLEPIINQKLGMPKGYSSFFRILYFLLSREIASERR